MKIRSLDFRAYKQRRSVPLRNGRLVYDVSSVCLVEVQSTAAGVSGLGLGVGILYPEGEQVYAALVRVFDRLLHDEDPFKVERIWSSMWQPKLLGRRGSEVRVMSMIDIALWDLKAKAMGVPLSDLLGGFADSVPYYTAGGYYEPGKDIDSLVDEMQGYVASGATAVKMKIGGLPLATDLQRIEAVRAALPASVGIMVDANGAYSVADAVRMARLMEPYDITWFEEPVQPDDYDGYAAVASASPIPVAGGENEATLYGFRDLIDRGHVSVVNPDAEIMGGITEFMKVAAFAQAHGVLVAPHGHADIHVPLTCAIPNGYLVEYYEGNVDPLAAALIPERPVHVGGRVYPSNRPGLGFEVDEAAVAEYRVL